jgi:TRAP-type C4-dicarboxylate transport system substrate-binding protein
VSDTTATGISRRGYLSGIGVAGTVGLAGCLSGIRNGGGKSPSTFKYGTVGSESANGMGNVDPYGAWTLADRLAEKSDGDVKMDIIGDSQVCGESDCIGKIRNDIVQAGTTSVGNTTKFSPENNIWALPYLFPPDNRAALSYGIFSETAWKQFWVPFAKQYNYVPFIGYPAQHRVIHIGQSGAKQVDGERVTTPDQIEGMDIRRTVSRIPAKAITEWGGSPVKVSWGDAIQGLKSGLIGGMETWLTNVAAYGMLPSLDQTVLNNWSLGIEMSWANVDWLKSLSDEHRSLIAQESERVTEELIHNTEEVITDRAGAVEEPPEGTDYGKSNIKVNVPSESELEQWKDATAYKRNSDLYSKTFEQAGTLLGGPDAARDFADSIYELTRSSSAPESTADFTLTSWWDDHLDEI